MQISRDRWIFFCSLLSVAKLHGNQTKHSVHSGFSIKTTMVILNVKRMFSLSDINSYPEMPSFNDSISECVQMRVLSLAYFLLYQRSFIVIFVRKS